MQWAVFMSASLQGAWVGLTTDSERKTIRSGMGRIFGGAKALGNLVAHARYSAGDKDWLSQRPNDAQPTCGQSIAKLRAEYEVTKS
jgi:hypothetical protein